MKPRILRNFFMLVLLLISFSVNAQKSRTFAITGIIKGDLNWTAVREIDLSTGLVLNNIYLPSEAQPKRFDANTGASIENINAVQYNSAVREYTAFVPDGGLIAASAYDAKYNRLYFTPVTANDLRYIDLSSKDLKIYYVRDYLLRSFAVRDGEADNITRMVFGADGNGYALTNDGNHLLQFTTGKSIVIKDFGSLIDGTKNGKMSVHDATGSWGGDMIADVFGNLYLFTVKSRVFKINPKNMIADYVGTIKDLPANYSVNAAAVNDDGDVVISSSINTNAYYKVNLLTLGSSKISQKEDKIYNASDFANANLAFQNKQTDPETMVTDNFVMVFPNPVTNKQVTLYFSKALTGRYMVELNDVNGRKLSNNTFELTSQQTHKLQLPNTASAGTYVIRVIGENNASHSAKLVVE